MVLAERLCSWRFLKRPTLQRCGDWDFFISIVESHHQSHSGFVCVNVFEFERDPDENCIALRMPFYSSEDLMEFSEGFDGKCGSSYWNLWILNAVFGILVYRSTFIGWIYPDSETLDKNTFFFLHAFMHLAEAFMQSDTAFNISFYQLMHSLGIKPMTLVLQHNSPFALYLNSDASKWKCVQNWNFRIFGLKLKMLTILNEPFETEGL